MSIKAAILSTFFALLSGNAMAGFIVGNVPMPHAAAVAYCISQGSRLADVNQANRALLIAELKGKPGWIASWDSNYYTGSCTYSINDHIGPNDCKELLYPVCNPTLNPHPHPHHDSHSHSHSHSFSHSGSHSFPGPMPHPHHDSHSFPGPMPHPHHDSPSRANLYKSFNAGAEEQACGPRRSRSSRSSSSSYGCDSSSSVGCDVPFQYVYLTNTVTTSFTSTDFVTETTTSTDTIIFATVAAYTVTGSD